MIKIKKYNKHGIHSLIFDAKSYLYYLKYNWYIKKSRNTFYLSRYFKYKTIDFHRSFLNIKSPNFVADHINGNGLDNRICNLRKVNKYQNAMNRRKTRGISKYKGVTWRYQMNKWEARIIFNKKYKYLGCFKNERDAANAYDIAAKKYFGEFAKLNLGIK